MDSFKMGDLVRVLADEWRVRQFQVHHGEWNDSMRRALGETGSVVKVYADGDLRVTIKGQTWTFNPLCLQAVNHNNKPSAASTTAQKRRSYLPTDDEKHFVSWAVCGDIKAVQHALGSHPTVVSPKVARAALQGAAQEGHLDVVDVLCARFPDQTHAKYKGTTALHVALHQGHLKVAERLLAAGIPPGEVARDDTGDSWLHYCAYGKQADGIELVMARRLQDVNVRNEKGSTALHVAVMLQDEKCVRTLLRHSVDVNAADADGDTALHEAVARDSAAIVQLLLEAPGANASAFNGSGLTAMHRAAMKGNAGAVRVLTAHDGKLAQDVKQDGFHSLHIAALNGHAEVVALLLNDVRCEANVRDNAGRTPLHHACFQGKRRVAGLLLDAPDVDVSARDAHGNTPLHVALSREGEISAEHDEEDDEFFQLAVAAGVAAGLAPWVALGMMLIAKGADPTVKNRKGHAAFDRLQDCNARAVLLKKALEQAPADFEKQKEALGEEQSKTEGEDDFGDERVECQVCSELTRAVILKPCDHAVACADCTRRMKKCLVCKEAIQDLVFPVAEGVAASPSSSPFSRHRSASSHVRDLEARVLDYEEQYMCSICMERRKNVAFLCGHGACTECVHTLKLCHMCRSPISGKINLY
jgi:E3 ubiquitin-protein ligase mind-bomb